ncbi:MAG: DNA-binding transcriptional regulator GbsR (MarR family) [Verrucomicrobiales bacterium]|jgi:DNA-binding transcriptional regulator GbsR (MarR family)
MSNLPPFLQNFILHWGEMGAKWGINRTVAQIHALLMTSDDPMHAEEICTKLGVARSNVSNSLKELQNWGIVKVVHIPSDRRDHFESMKDVYEMFRVIAAERKSREVDPTLSALRNCSIEAEDAKAQDEIYAKEKIEDLLEFFELVSDVYDRMNKLPTKTAIKAFKMGDQLLKPLGLFD